MLFIISTPKPVCRMYCQSSLNQCYVIVVTTCSNYFLRIGTSFSLEDMSRPLGDIFPQIVGSTWDLFMFTCGNTLCTWKKKHHEKHHSSQESYFLHMDLFHHHLGSTCGRWHTFLTWGNTFYSVLDRFSSHTDMFTSFVNKCFNKECNFLHFGTCFVQFRIYFFSLGKILLGARECTFFTCGYIWFT